MYQVIIIAGGLGTRLYPKTEQLPKALIPINDEPFIFHQLRLLKRQGVSRVLMLVGHLGDQIEKIVGNGDSFGLHIDYHYDGEKLLGTAGCIRAALPQLNEHFFTIYGDSYLDCNMQAVQAHFEKSTKPALMTVYNNKNSWDTSNVEFIDGEIKAYNKEVITDSMHHIDYGLGIFSRSVFESLPANTKIDLADVYGDLLNNNQLTGYEVPSRFYEVGSFTGITDLEKHLLNTTTELTHS